MTEDVQCTVYRRKWRINYHGKRASKIMNMSFRPPGDQRSMEILLSRVGCKCMKCEESAVAIARTKDPFCK